MNKSSKIISIFGSTGSIGKNSLLVIDNLIRNNYEIAVRYLTTNTRIDDLAVQIKKYSPAGVVIHDEEAYQNFRSKYEFENLEVLNGKDGLIQISKRDDHNFLINALVGFSGLEPTIEAIKSKKDIALANKESLVIAGKIITGLLKENDTKLFPIDSEHSAILQCLSGEEQNSVNRIFLTASGGPFRKKSIDEIRNATIEDALNHPNWKMGKKITIDSATMMNKGLEVIEAKWLFDVNAENIEVLIHPESVIHSMVEFEDGSVKAQLGIPDMKIPIQYSLTYPERIKSEFPKMDFKTFNILNFEEPDFEKFRCLQLAYDVLKVEGTYPAVMNAANEIAVDLFLNGSIRFHQIPDIIESALEAHTGNHEFSLEMIREADIGTRNEIRKKYC
ncbi:MAG TPA: 1-deoxy-D-xylulose-5-phosphate reductoisomerase [Ignavibacteria bacterium]|nr:1-deoxy-D-xylulose-5-phosphate reductoisomerase [Ignavibacteria bacterium]